jgi:DNA-binding NarL/FixJ family response regulator
MGIQVAFLTNDLLFSSRVMSLARQVGIDMKVVGARQAFLDQAAASECVLALIDLEHPAAAMKDLVRDLHRRENAPKIVAYGPHVKESLLGAAQEAGADSVLSRGQFDKQIGGILQDLAAQAPPESPRESL